MMGSFIKKTRICDALEEMSMKAGERPEETAEVVALQNYLSECRDERIFAIKDEIKIVAKRVVFLLTHTQLTSKYRLCKYSVRRTNKNDHKSIP